MGATYSAFQLIGAPILGKWSDTYGRKKVLLLSNAGTLAGWIFFVFTLYSPLQNLIIDFSVLGTFIISLPLILLFLARAIDGITGEIFLSPTHILQIYRQKKIGVATLEKWECQLI